MVREVFPVTFGKYLLVEPLGIGGVSQVFAARIAGDERSPALVIKVLRKELSGHPEQILRFRHEAEMGLLLSGPHWPRAHEVGSVGGTMFIAMERIFGLSLHEISRRAGGGRGLGLSVAVRLFGDYLAGLQVLHGLVDPETQRPLGLVHRDV